LSVIRALGSKGKGEYKMPYHIDYWEDEKIIMIKDTGESFYNDFVQQSKEALALARSKNARLFFSDCILLENKASIFDIYNLPKVYDEIGASRLNRLALLIKADSPDAAVFRFYETACRNRGWNVKVFTNYDEAMAWLKQ
jgi:hypothetical protein